MTYFRHHWHQSPPLPSLTHHTILLRGDIYQDSLLVLVTSLSSDLINHIVFIFIVLISQIKGYCHENERLYLLSLFPAQCNERRTCRHQSVISCVQHPQGRHRTHCFGLSSILKGHQILPRYYLRPKPSEHHIKANIRSWAVKKHEIVYDLCPTSCSLFWSSTISAAPGDQRNIVSVL